MKQKGFTLIELLAVIVVLGLLAVIAVPSVTSVIKNNEQKLYDAQLELIKDAAEGYIAEHIFTLKFDGTDVITLQQLKDENYVDREIQNPKTKTKFCDTLKIKIVPVQGTKSYKIEFVSDTIKSEPNC